MKKRDVIAAVRMEYPEATAYSGYRRGCAFCEILPHGNVLSGYQPIGSGSTEYAAWSEALRTIRRAPVRET